MTREPEWSDVDRDEALALSLFEDALCDGCGTDIRLGFDADRAASGVNVDDSQVCWVCKAREMHVRNLHDQHKDHDDWFDGRQIVARLIDEGGDPGW